MQLIGVFDSGAGGLAALSEIRRMCPTADVCFFADYENAPYGTKTEAELIRLVSANITRLRDAGADKILMACCTASTVYRHLPIDLRNVSIPIIDATANEALLSTENGKIGVIATKATVESGAFKCSLTRHKNTARVWQIAAQSLVKDVEAGICDGKISAGQRDALFRMLLPLKKKGIDTIVLGCTHFAKLEREISRVLPGVRIINSARIGAKEILKQSSRRGCGKTLYL